MDGLAGRDEGEGESAETVRSVGKRIVQADDNKTNENKTKGQGNAPQRAITRGAH